MDAFLKMTQSAPSMPFVLVSVVMFFNDGKHEERPPGRKTICQTVTFRCILKMHQLVLLHPAEEQLKSSGSMLAHFLFFQLPYLVRKGEKQRDDDGGGENGEISGARRKRKRWFITKERTGPRLSKLLLHTLSAHTDKGHNSSSYYYILFSK